MVHEEVDRALEALEARGGLTTVQRTIVATMTVRIAMAIAPATTVALGNRSAESAEGTAVIATPSEDGADR